MREDAPNLLLQMLLRGANGVGYKNYPDNVVKYFVRQAAKGGIDLFRVFDCLNWVDNMRVSMDAVAEENKLCEAAICYTGDILNSARPKYDLKYYTALAAELEKAGAHIIALKDMAGLLKPAAATVLFKALREATDLPIHFHTHDTSGIAAATVLAAVDAGVDVVDAAMDALLRQYLAALPRLDRRGAAAAPSAIRVSIRNGSAASPSIGKPCATSTPPSKATSRDRRRKSTCTKCRAASSPTSRNRPARSGSRPAGTRWRRPMPTPTRCSAISSR